MIESKWLPSEMLFERPKSASDSIADTIKTGWKKWADGRCYGGGGGGRRKGGAFLSFCMFLDEMHVRCLFLI